MFMYRVIGQQAVCVLGGGGGAWNRADTLESILCLCDGSEIEFMFVSC